MKFSKEKEILVKTGAPSENTGGPQVFIGVKNKCSQRIAELHPTDCGILSGEPLVPNSKLHWTSLDTILNKSVACGWTPANCRGFASETYLKRTEVREWKSQTSMEVPDLNALDVVMASPSIVQGPIDYLFEVLGDEEKDWGAEGLDGKARAGADDDKDDEE
ncbi:hypothetical protein HAX54_021916 [Datura stramonium]|uniref:Uncharacterized protein n=1 Tax=Datura stramonium TaxID=4076 RepID=A0ABS8UU73_DATST|nr:hypothetical protein [Datura stramonium]